jgi:hypothetical protein
MKHDIKYFVLPVLACMAVLVLVACSALAATPRAIASAYQTPIAVYPTQVPPVEQVVTVYNLDLELSVRDIQYATDTILQ